ncbi:MAG: hypothetical protein ABI833_16045 [Acidobacteriota bacterium]
MNRTPRIPDGDSLFRHSIHPLVFRSQGKTFAPEKWITIYPQDDGSLLASLAWGRYVPTTRHVHGYGCRLAFGINQRKREAGKFKEKDRHIYCGAYELKGSSIRALAATELLEELFPPTLFTAQRKGKLPTQI